MIVATLSEIYILLLIQTSQNSPLEIHKTDFIFKTNDKIITSITSTSENRIFVAGENNNIWELNYENSKSFFGFGKKSTKISRQSQSFFEKIFPFSFYYPKYSYFSKLIVDNTRHLLYALNYYSNNENIFDIDNIYDSCISIYDLGSDGNSFEKIGQINQETLIENFRQSLFGMNLNPNNYIITDIIPFRRNEMKFNHLLIITRNGIKIFIKFDVIIDEKKYPNEDFIMNINSNKIYRKRIVPRFSINEKAIPQPKIINYKLNSLGEKIPCPPFEKIYYINNKCFVHVKDENQKCSYIDVHENDLSDLIKNENFFIPSNLQKQKEIISNVYTFDINKKLYGIYKLNEYSSLIECDINSLLKRSDYSNFIYPNIKYLDCEERFSYTCMHEYAYQFFTAPEEYFLMLSDEIIEIVRMRPIDHLVSIIASNNNNNINIANIQNNENNQVDLFENFLNNYGFIETGVMLFYIMINKSCSFYSKINQVFRNNIGNELNEDIYPKGFIEIKNNENIIQRAEKCFLKTFEYSMKNIEKVFFQKEKELISQMQNNFIQTNQKIPNFTSTTLIYEKYKIRNYISYIFLLFISRYVRLFWEEPLYTMNKINSLYNENQYFISDTIKLHQIHFLRNIFINISLQIKSMKDSLFQRGNKIDGSIRKIISEINKKISKPNQENKQRGINGNLNPILISNNNDIENNSIDINTIQEISNLYNFGNFQKEIETILSSIDKLIELLSFIEMVYSTVSLKQILETKNLIEIIKLKFKDIFNKNMPYVIQALLEELFGVILNEFDYVTVGNKLNELSKKCPDILSINEIELIKANLLLKISKNIHQDEISRRNIINKAIQLLLANPENIKINQIVEFLSHNNEVKPIIQLCVVKAMFLIEKISNDNYNNLGGEEKMKKKNEINENNEIFLMDSKENDLKEYQKCLYIILRLLDEIQKGILNDKYDTKINKKFSNPQYMKNLLEGKTKNELLQMRNEIITTILTYNAKFIHELLFDYLKSKNLIEELNSINSPYVEGYLNNQINQEKEDPEKYINLYKFYLNSKNYEASTRILLQLINFDNDKIKEINDDKNYISLKQRIEFTKQLIYSLTMQLEESNYLEDKIIAEDKKREIISIKERILDFQSTLLIQNDIYNYLCKAYKNLDIRLNENDKENANELQEQLNSTEEALIFLDRKIYDLNQLYYDFSKKFKILDMNFRIYFEFEKKGNEVPQNEIYENYNNYFNFISNSAEKELIFPGICFDTFSLIFITLVEGKTKYESFYYMLKNNGYKNLLEKFIPLEMIIDNIEKLNCECIFENKIFDNGDNYLLRASLPYDGNYNIFWFICFLKDKVSLPLWFIYQYYEKISKNIITYNHKLFFYILKSSIIKYWCEEIDSFLKNYERKRKGSSNQAYNDYLNFKSKYNDLLLTVKEMYDSEELNKIFSVIISPQKYQSIKEFIDAIIHYLSDIIEKINKLGDDKSYFSNLDLIDKSSLLSKDYK